MGTSSISSLVVSLTSLVCVAKPKIIQNLTLYRTALFTYQNKEKNKRFVGRPSATLAQLYINNSHPL